MENNGRVLVVTSNRKMRRCANRALASAGFLVENLPPDEQVIRDALAQDVRLCVVDASEGLDVSWLMNLLYREHRDIITLITAEDDGTPYVRESLARRRLNHMIAKHGGIHATSNVIDEAELIVTCQKLLCDDIFGLEKYLATWGIKIHDLPIAGTEDKRYALAELDQFLEQIDCYSPMRHPIRLVADELIANALFNAPLDESGKPKYRHLDRGAPLQLEPAEQAQFRFACDGRHLALSVSDPAGSLDRSLLADYLDAYFAKRPPEIRPEEHSSLGLYMVVNSITQLIFNVQEGERTEVVATFYVHSGTRAFVRSGKSLNIFYRS